MRGFCPAFASLLTLGLGACQSDLDRLGRPPVLTPIGTGLNAPREPLPTAFGAYGRRHGYHSTWSPASAET
jgi:flagellar L-ring protein precursor FlgH